ncbi:hypothetical protein [Bacillus toyonensis]|uniref:hypothetical protein n=1 Tax=Bacillus toyonensis TaxID=155322 RepID=UPI002E1A70FB|nr:hypothetical protein [Bacillus toyonensis]
MTQFYETIHLIAKTTLESITGYSPADFEIIKVSADSSVLYQEIQVLFSYRLDKGLFRTNKHLREFRYDYSNKCGVLLQVADKDDPNAKVIKCFGDEGILAEKDWI